jgi:hypothetical protein
VGGVGRGEPRPYKPNSDADAIGGKLSSGSSRDYQQYVHFDVEVTIPSFPPLLRPSMMSSGRLFKSRQEAE